MLKRIVLGVLMAGLITVLVAGAIIRTADKTAQVAEARGLENGRGFGQTAGAEHDCDGADQGNNSREPAAGGAQGLGQGEGGGNGQGGGGHGQGGGGQGQGGGGQAGYGDDGSAGAPGQPATGLAQVSEWVSVEGTVASVDSSALVVDLNDGHQFVVEGRPWQFAQEAGLSVKAEDQITVTGFYEDGEFKVGQIENASSGQSILIREESGRPLWAGHGRRGE
jgi:hypothetical protein